MIRNTTFASLLLSCLSVMPAFAEDDVLTKAREIPVRPRKSNWARCFILTRAYLPATLSAVILAITSGSAEPTQSQHP